VVLAGRIGTEPEQQIPMRKTRGGDWFVNAELVPGRLEYVFLVDGKPILDELSPSEEDGQGGKRSYFFIDDDREAKPSEQGPKGKLELKKIKSAALAANIPVNVYTPPGFSRKSKYPVLFLLHGYQMNEQQWVTGGIVNYLDRYIGSKELPPMIVVMPGVPSEFYMGTTEDFFVKDLVPWIAKSYPVVKGKAKFAIGGMSMGGFGAFYLTYRHPDLFGHSMILSPGALDQKFLDQLEAELAGGKRVETPLDIRCGKGDKLVIGFAERLHAILEANKVTHRWEVTRGEHDWDYWRSVMKSALLPVGQFFRKEG
jgi:enterochelin esterase-like enzyme